MQHSYLIGGLVVGLLLIPDSLSMIKNKGYFEYSYLSMVSGVAGNLWGLLTIGALLYGDFTRSVIWIPLMYTVGITIAWIYAPFKARSLYKKFGFRDRVPFPLWLVWISLGFGAIYASACLYGLILSR